jgi:ribose 5-phosphate isomerase B
MRIALGSDHRGFKLKQEINNFLVKQGYEIKDFGSFSEETCDYPDFALPVAETVASGEYRKGILVCGSGIGMCIAANKVPGIRAALVFNEDLARMTAAHNDSNVLCLSERTPAREAMGIIRVWLETPFEGGRHKNRIDKISNIEKVFLRNPEK